MKKILINHLKELITEERYELFCNILSRRTNYVTVVLEDIFQPQNASAVVRSCDCFGVQNLHIIENENLYRINPDVALGSTKWINLNRYNKLENNSLVAINKLKEQGYRIIATTPHGNPTDLNDFDVLKGKFAVMFGAEVPGLSKIALQNADEFVKIPMQGFTESLNISVSAAVFLNTVTTKIRNSDIDFKLTDEEQDEVMLNWLRQSIKKSEKIERILMERLGLEKK